MNWGFTSGVVRAVCAALVLGMVCHIAGAREASTETASAGTIDDQLMVKLKETVGDFDYDREDFDRIIDDLRERFGLNIHVSWKALKDAGIQPDERVSITLMQVPLTTFLDLLLLETVDDRLMEVSYFVSSGVLMLSTELATRPPTVLRTYDVTDLIESGYSIRRFANTPVLSLEVTGREFIGGEERAKRRPAGGGGAGGGGGGSIFADPDHHPVRVSQMARIQQYVELIIEHVDPSGWRQLGGDVGQIQAVNSTLFVEQTVEAHMEISRLLEMVRATKPVPLDVDAVVLQIRPEDVDRLRAEAGECFPRLSEETAAPLFNDSDAHPALFRGTTSGFNGERLWFSAVAQQDVLSGLIPIVGADVNAFGTAQGIVTDGIELVMLPLLLSDGEHAEVDVQFAWIPPTIVSQRSYTPASNAEQTSVDVTRRRMRTVSSTAQVQIGQAIALAIPEEPGAGDEYEEWLVVRVRDVADSMHLANTN